MKNKFASHRQYLFSLLTSRNTRKTQTNQSILQFFYSLLKETIHKTSKITAAKMFSPVYLLLVGLWWNCFIPCDDWKTLFNILLLFWAFFNRYVVTFFKAFWKHFTFYALLSQSFKMRLHILFLYFFVTNFTIVAVSNFSL